MLPRSTPAAQNLSSRSIGALLDWLGTRAVEGHSIMVVRHGHVVAEGWWTPYSADRPTLLYSVTKSFTSIAAGLVIADGLLALDDRVAGLLPAHVPGDISAQGRRLTVHHLLSMTTGHGADSLAESWEREPADLVKGFHGLHLTTEALAAFGELLLRGGRWGDRQLIPREWVELATRAHIGVPAAGDDSARGYGYQFWISEHGFYADGAFGQQCVVLPSLDLVVVLTSHNPRPAATPDAIAACLAPGIGHPDSARDDEVLADRLRRLSFPPVPGSAGPPRSGKATIVAAAESALPTGSAVHVEPADGGWRLRFDSFRTASPDPGAVEAGHGEWRESAPLGRPVVASGAWQGGTFVAELFVITTPHRVRLVVEGDTATATWSTVPLTTPDLALHLQAPLMTRPDVA
ncbi:serine hydrolase domain-containing protein [Paractinoplanes rhizophilus]|uniref:Serine hydrolase domain-containing protein n=1 Tax=Paractinoplanes rhizophilus TaxID=1416877 RepID=A0ABW2HT12_9ACTN